MTYPQPAEVREQHGQEIKRPKTSLFVKVCVGLIIILVLIGGGIYAYNEFFAGKFIIAPAEEPLPVDKPPPPDAATVPAPVIVAFGAAPDTVTVAQTVTLQWEVTGADVVSIDQGIGEVPVTGNRKLSPETSTVYRLTATNAGGSVTRTAAVTVFENVNAKDIVITEDDVKPKGFVHDMNSEPTEADTISTHYTQFTRGGHTLYNSVYIYSTVSAAVDSYSEIKFNNRTNVTDIVTLGDRGYYITLTGMDSYESEIYSIRFQKNNVYVTIGGISDLEELESYARIVELRIK